jgi:hypothetical protein
MAPQAERFRAPDATRSRAQNAGGSLTPPMPRAPADERAPCGRIDCSRVLNTGPLDRHMTGEEENEIWNLRAYGRLRTSAQAAFRESAVAHRRL